MPRNNNGVYSLPQAPFVPGTVISSAAVNSDFADIAAALTGSIAANGSTPITGQLKSSITTTPAYSSSADGTTGFGSSTAGEADIWASGTIIVQVTSTGATVNGNQTVTGNLTVTGSVTAASFNFSGTGAIQIPAGNTAQRPASPVQGDIRYNSTNANFEGYDGTEWDVMSNVNAKFTLSASVGSSLLTVNFLNALTGAAPTAADPVAISFRDTTLANGDPVGALVTSALSINTNGIGASLGSVNGVPFRFWVVAFNNAGTVVLGLINCSTSTQIFPLNEAALQSSTAISNSAASAGVFYTPNGTTVSNKPMKILGYLEYANGLATAGTYISTPTTLQLFGSGIKKPGDVIQKVMALVNSSTSCGASPTQTTVTASITPTSTVNLIEVKSNIAGQIGSVIVGQVQLSRGTGPTLIGPAVNIAGSTNGGGTSINIPTPLMSWDFPATTSAQAYYVFGKTMVVAGVAGGCTIDLTEIMG